MLEADVSSFTPLTEELARRHGARRGAEEVAALLTRVYGPLVAEVDRFAGSVVDFTGDAVSCCFHDDDGSRALRCGLAMQAAMVALRTDAADSPALKVAVATGALRRFSSGDPAIRRLEVLAGPAVDRLAVVSLHAGPGEVLADASTVRALGTAIEVDGRRGGDRGSAARVVAVHGPPPAPAGEPPEIDAEQARHWLHPSVHERLLESGEQALGDLRTVVALFARFGGIDYAAEDAGRRLDEYTSFAQRVLEDYGGTLFHVAIDAKGSYLCAGFGAPIAHDDDPLRAAATALVLREPPPAAGNVQVGGIGLTRGRMYAGTYGGRTRRTFGVQGSKMILAARLMENAAPGQVLLEESLAVDLEQRNELRRLAPRTIKGRGAPVEVSELLGPNRPAPTVDAPPDLVNRTKERDVLENRLRRLRVGEGGVVVIEGEPGIGKSRLAHFLTDRAAAEGFAVRGGAGDPIERGAPYHGWHQVFAGTAGPHRRSDDASAVGARIPEGLRAAPGASATIDDRDITVLLSAVMPVELPDGPVTVSLSGEARAEATRDLLADMLGELARERPTLVVLEDAHWLDSASLSLALRLASAPGPLLLVLVTRPIRESGLADLGRLVAIPGCEHLRVGPLLTAEAVELGARALGAIVPLGLAALIEAKAGGNPLFTRELAYALRDADPLDQLARTAAAGGDLTAGNSPDRVETVIASRVDRLPAAAQTLLKVGSVLGLSFAEDALLALAGRRVLEQRTHLEAIDLLAPASAVAPGTLVFRHALIRDVVYSQLLYAQRRELHQRAAEYYERTRPAGSTRAALAYHWEQAAMPHRAVEHLIAIGADALRAGAFRECLDAYERALALTVDQTMPGRRPGWQWYAAQACYRLGEIDRSIEFGAAAIAGLDRPVPPGGPVAVGIAATVEVTRQILLHRTLPRLLPRAAPAAERHDLRLAVETLAMMAEVYYVAADTARSSYVAVRALNLAERLGPCGELAGCYGTTCVIAGLVGAHRLAEHYGELSRRTAAGLDDGYWRALSLQQRCHYRSGVGPYGAFSELYIAAIAQYRRLGNRPRLRDTAGMAGIADHLFGRPEAAELHLNELLAAVKPQEATLGEGWAHLWLGMVALRRGETDETLERLRTVSRLRGDDVVDLVSVNVRAICALASWRAGQDSQAREEEAAARAVIDRLGRRPGAHFVLDGYAALAELALARWDEARSLLERARARWAIRDALRNLRAYTRVFPIGEPARSLYEGERAWRTGRPGRAEAAWRRALASAQRLDMRHELALAHAALGDHLADDRERAEHEQRGAVLLTQLGAPLGTRAVTPRRPAPD
ncbi:MAG: hypothetical protein QOH12_114 [Solirubrobacteraceae bacterium]|nr:hypothetical protein [Solirubrobacteraceae bacterium]